MSDEDEPPKYIWRTIPGRIKFDYQVELMRFPEMGSMESLKDYVYQRKKLSIQVSILYGIVIFIAFSLLQLVGADSNLSISFYLIRIDNVSFDQSFVSFILSILYSYLIFRLMSLYAISHLLDAATAALGLDGEHLITSRWDATNLWAFGLRPRAIGYNSEWPHWVLAIGFLVVSTTILLAILSLCVIATFLVAIHSGEPFSIPSIVSWLAFVATFSATLMSVLFFFVPFRFQRLSQVT